VLGNRDVACSPAHRQPSARPRRRILIGLADWFIGGVPVASQRTGAQIPITICSLTTAHRRFLLEACQHLPSDPLCAGQISSHG
jgi:hypothetical protein